MVFMKGTPQEPRCGKLCALGECNSLALYDGAAVHATCVIVHVQGQSMYMYMYGCNIRTASLLITSTVNGFLASSSSVGLNPCFYADCRLQKLESSLGN